MSYKREKKKNYAPIIFIIIGGIIGFFMGIFLSEYAEKGNTAGNGSSMSLLDFLIIFASLYVSSFLSTIIHEGGHLVMGLATDYKFLSFRVGSVMIAKTDEGLKFKKYSIAGTGGQCLLAPPDVKNPEKMPFFWYNFGGGLFNLLTALICLPFILIAENKLLKIVLIVFAVTSVFSGLVNLIPLKLAVSNDGMNILTFLRNPYANGICTNQLKINALQTRGTRLKDMPENLFEYDENQTDSFSSTMLALKASRLADEFKFEEAEQLYDKYLDNPKIPQILYYEALCELLFCKLINGASKETIEEIYDKDLQNYIKSSGKTMISRRKLMYAYWLIFEKNPENAKKEYDLAHKMKDTYPIKGDAESELAIIEYVKENFAK